MKNQIKLIITFCTLFISSIINNIQAQTWQHYDSLRVFYMQKQSFDTALAFAEKALLAVKEKTSENDTLYASMLTPIMEINYYTGNYPKAIEYCQKEIEIRKVKQGLKHPEYATSLNNLGQIYGTTGNYTMSENLYLESIKIRKEVLGTKNADYAASLNNLATLYMGLGKFPAAAKLFIEAKDIKKEILGEMHIDYATALNNLAQFYLQTGNYSASLPLLTEAIKIFEKLLGKKHTTYGTALNNLAVLYYSMGDYSSAMRFYLEAKDICKNVLGEKHPSYALSLTNLAQLYQTMGNYSASELYFLEAKQIRKDVLGVKHTDYAQTINNLALLYHAMGNYSAEEPLMLEASNIWKEVLGEKNSDYAISLNNLASFYMTMEKYSIVEKYYFKARDIQKAIFGEKHPRYALTLSNLAVLYQMTGNYPAAESLFLEVKNIRKEVLGPKHLDYAQSVINLGSLYQTINKNSDAELLFLEGLNIYKEILGNEHPSYATTLTSLAGLYQNMNENVKAEEAYNESIKIRMTNIKQYFGFLSEKEKGNYIKTLNSNFNQFTDFALKRYKNNPLISQNLYNITLATKGLLLKSSNRIRMEINSSNDTVLENQYRNWQILKEDIGRYSQWSKEKRKKLFVNLDSLEIQANFIEKQISLKSNVFANDNKSNEISWNQVQDKLGVKDVAIEFITYQPLNSIKEIKKSDTTMYCALVIRKEDKSPQILSLCNNFELASILKKTELYKTTSQIKGVKPIINTYVDDESESQILYKLLWKPLDTILSGREKIYISLSGLMNKISINSLQDDNKQMLLNKYDIRFVNSTRQLAIEENTNTEITKSIALFGGINYDYDSTKTKSEIININAIASRGLLSDTAISNKWNYLAGTLTEVKNIDKIFSKNKWDSKLYTGNSGTEEAFKLLSGKNSPGILHISTHGFFFPEPDSNTYKTTRNPYKTMQNPLWRTGILFANANYTWQCKKNTQESEDGVLSAYEVSNSNLKNTDLVVLSACETGLGDIKGSEGVYGLQRAFQVAGAKAVIMSLWSVPDKETTELMSLFYESYIKTKNKHESFRQAQQTLAKKYAPYYWAAFVLVE